MVGAAVEPVADSPTGTSSQSEKYNGNSLRASPASSSSEITNSQPTVLIAGGGLPGLLAGVALQSAGCDVHIFDAAEYAESAEGGIQVSPELQAFCAKYKMQGWKSTMSVGRQVLGHDGEPVLEDSTQQRYTSWDILYRSLRKSIPKDHFHTVSIASVDVSQKDCVTAVLVNQDRITGHMLVAADGPFSPIRQQLAGGQAAQYAGYLAWQGLVALEELPDEVQELLAGKTTIYKGINQHMQVHPVPLVGMLRGEGEPHLAWSWFNNQEAEEVPDLLVDSGNSSHPLAVPMGKLSVNVATAVGTATTQALPEPLAALVTASSKCMSVTAISDLTTPRIVFGRVALLGDTATLLRPHAGMSTASQAAAAAVALADTLVEKKFAVERALAAWQEAVHPQQLALSRQSSKAGDRLQGFEQ